VTATVRERRRKRPHHPQQPSTDAASGHETLDLAEALAAMSYRHDTLPDGPSIGDVSP
jgi:hypothetical protein